MLHTSPIVPVFIKSDTFGHLRSHESRLPTIFQSGSAERTHQGTYMNDPDSDPLILQVQAQKLADHIQSTLARMMGVIASTFLLVSQSNASTL